MIARGLSRLAIDAVTGVVDVVEAMHANIATVPGVTTPPPHGRTRGITGIVYRSIRGTTRAVGEVLDASLAVLDPLLRTGGAFSGSDAVLAALNGVLGDYLAASGNPLAMAMSVRRDGVDLPLEARALADALPGASRKVLVLVHGLCMSDGQWRRRGHDHGAALARDLGCTAVYLRYNTGLHVSVNGRAFAEMLEAMLRHWPVPVEELTIVGHSMGGLVARSACHYGAAAGHAWVRRLASLVFLGTPHHGAPLERGGSIVDALLGGSRYTAPLARLGKVRSAGITDLRYGNVVDEDWAGRDRFDRSGDARVPVPLPADVRCYAIAATKATRTQGARMRALGDGLVPLASALGRHADARLSLRFAPSHRWTGYAMGHLDLLERRAVYAQMRRWLAA